MWQQRDGHFWRGLRATSVDNICVKFRRHYFSYTKWTRAVLLTVSVWQSWEVQSRDSQAGFNSRWTELSRPVPQSYQPNRSVVSRGAVFLVITRCHIEIIVKKKWGSVGFFNAFSNFNIILFILLNPLFKQLSVADLFRLLPLTSGIHCLTMLSRLFSASTGHLSVSVILLLLAL